MISPRLSGVQPRFLKSKDIADRSGKSRASGSVLNLLQHARFRADRNPRPEVLAAVGIDSDLRVQAEVVIGAIAIGRSKTRDQIASAL